MSKLLKGRDVLLLSSSVYKTLYNSKLNVHFISEELSKSGNKVLFVESLGLKDFPFFGKTGSIKAFYRVLRFIKLLFVGPEKINDNLYVLSLVRVPYDSLSIISKFNQKVLSYFITKYTKKLLDPSPVIWSFLPTFWYLPDRIPNSGVIYYSVDNYSESPNVNKSYIVTSERKMLKKANIVFSTSIKRVDYFKEYTDSEVVPLTNVGNFQQFNMALEKNIEIPKDIEKIVNLGKPIVGFVGNLSSSKEDVRLLFETAKLSKEFNFVIIGGIGEGSFFTNVSNLRSLTNVHFLGSKEYELLYRYLHFFDLAIIPRKLDAVGEGGFPMKYFEFLSAGIPTLVTGVGNMKQFTKIARLGGVANSAKDFLKLMNYWINLKIKNTGEYNQAVKERIKLAKLNSWDRRITQLNTLISKVIK